jgi:hypothetical protein
MPEMIAPGHGQRLSKDKDVTVNQQSRQDRAKMARFALIYDGWFVY